PEFTRQMAEQSAKMPGVIPIDTGEFNPILGYSYGEIAGLSRSNHATQAFGSAERRGSLGSYLLPLVGGKTIQAPGPGPMDAALKAFRPDHPEAILPVLVAARAKLPADRIAQLDETIAMCAGLWTDATTDRWFGSPVRITLASVARLQVPVRL